MISTPIHQNRCAARSGAVLWAAVCGLVLALLPTQLMAQDFSQDFWQTSPYHKHARAAQLLTQQSPFNILAYQLHRQGLAEAQAREEQEAQERYFKFWIDNFAVRQHLAGAQLVSWRDPFGLLAHRYFGKHMLVWGLEIPIDKNPRKLDRLVWFQSQNTPAVAVAQMVGLKDPFAVAAARQVGSYRFVWGPEVLPRGELAPPLHPDWILMAKDDAMFPNLAEKIREEWTEQEVVELNLFTQALYNAKYAGKEAFAKSAKLIEDDGVGWSHLYNAMRKQYRGKVIPLEGYLLRLRKYPAPLAARPIDRPQVEWYYEGWVQTETEGTTPICVIFAELPKGTKPFENVEKPRKVRFNGYYLKRYLYQIANKDAGPTDDNNRVWRATPYLIAPTFEYTTQVTSLIPDGWEFPLPAVMLLLTVVVAALIALFLANIWLRSGDAKVRAQIAAIKEQKFPTNLENVGTESSVTSSQMNEGGYFTTLTDEPEDEDYLDRPEESSDAEDLLLAPDKPRFQFPKDSEDG